MQKACVFHMANAFAHKEWRIRFVCTDLKGEMHYTDSLQVITNESAV